MYFPISHTLHSCIYSIYQHASKNCPGINCKAISLPQYNLCFSESLFLVLQIYHQQWQKASKSDALSRIFPTGSVVGESPLHQPKICSFPPSLLEKFMKWVESNLKHNSSLLTKEQCDDIRNFLKANDKSRFDKSLRKRVIKNQYETMQFPALNIEEKFYVFLPKVNR